MKAGRDDSPQYEHSRYRIHAAGVLYPLCSEGILVDVSVYGNVLFWRYSRLPQSVRQAL